MSQASMSNYSRPEPLHAGRTFLVGGSIVAGTLAGTWLLMLNHKRREQAAGKNPYHEQIVARLSAKQPAPDLNELRPIFSKASARPPAYIRSDHFSGHMTNKSPDWTQERRFQQPAPQVAHVDRPHKAYTKGFDYKDNYDKTLKARSIVGFHPDPGPVSMG